MTVYDTIDILLVEDDRHDAELTMRALTVNGARNDLHWVQDGAEALAFIRCTGAYAGRDPRQRPRLILVDLKMPTMTGLELVRALKSDEHTRAIPIVVMTSSQNELDVSESYRLGVNGYVTKPSSYADLTESVTQIATYWLRVNQVP